MRGAQAVANAPNITQSALFHVAKHAYPAPYGDTAAESHIMVVGIAIAILITEVRNTKLKKVYQSAILLPFLMSMVILSYIVYALLSAENGLVNNSILPLFHIDSIQWYQEPKYWPVILIIANCWKGVGYGCLIYIASLIGIDPSFYEAARLDGASKWQEITKITLPSLVPTIITLLLLSIGRIFYSDFGLFYHQRRSQRLLPARG